MSSLDIATAIGFSLLVFVLGLSFSRSGANAKSFFAAGGEVPWWISGLSLFMSFFSVGTFVVWGSIAYNHGFVAVVIQSTMSLAGLLVGFYIAPKWNKTNALTAAEFISERLGRTAQKFYTIIFLLLGLFSSGVFLYPVGKMLEVTTGIPLSTAILGIGLLIIIYTSVGGLWAVLVTDVLQFVVLTAAVLIVVPLAFDQVSGISGFIASAPEGFFNLTNEEYDIWFIAAFGFYNMVFIGGSWAYVQRFTSVANPKQAKKVGWLFGALYFVAPLIWMLPPMIYRLIEPNLDKSGSEGAYLMVSQLVVPDGLMGVIVGAMVFATASSVNTTLNISAGVFTNDIYKRFRKNISNLETMIVARVSTLVFGGMAIVFALMVQHLGGIVEVAFSLAAITGVPLCLPPIWALFSKRQTGFSVLVTTIVSIFISGFFKFISPSLFDFSLSRSPEMIVGVIVPIIILSVFELYYRLNQTVNTQYQAYVEQQQIQQESSFSALAHKEGVAANTFARKVIAIGLILIGLLIAALGVSAMHGQVIIASIGLVISIIGFVCFPKNKIMIKEVCNE